MTVTKEIAEDTEIYYFNARWYDANTGRFISEDPIRDGNLWYAYVSGNPMGFVDPSGLYRVYSYVDSKAGKTRYRMSTESDYTGGSFVYNTANLAFNVMPFGSIAETFNRHLYNFQSKMLGTNSHVVFDSFESGVDGVNTAIDLVSQHPLAKTIKDPVKNLLRINEKGSQATGIQGAFSDFVSDKRIQSFLDENVDFDILKYSGTDEEAIGIAEIFKAGVNTYFDKNLDEKGISREDWTAAIRDTFSGEGSDLFNSIMGKGASD